MEDNETRRYNEKLLEKIKPGDVIRFFAGCCEHWAVYAGENEKGEKIIIHWNRKNVASSHWLNWWKQSDVASNPRITIDSFWTCADTMKAEKEISDSIDGVKVVERVKAFKQKLEEEDTYKTYPDLFYSSEHFVKWCHYGLGTIPIKTEDIFRVTNVWKFVHGIFTNQMSDGKAIRSNVGVLRQLKPGDVVRFSRDSYEHWATYIGLDEDTKSLKSVIHWWDNDGATDPYIRIVSFWELAANCSAEKINTDELSKVSRKECEAFEDVRAWIGKSRTMFPNFIKCFHCPEDFAKFLYLKLMSKPKKEMMYPFYMREISHSFVAPFCNHTGKGDLSKNRNVLLEEVLMTLEFDKLSQLLDYVCPARKRHYEKTEEERFRSQMYMFCRLPWDSICPANDEYYKMTEEERHLVFMHNFRHLFGYVFSARKGHNEKIEEEHRCEAIHLFGHLPWDPVTIFIRRKNDEILETLKFGDLIEFVENSWNHWGIYIGKENDDDSFIHWTADDHAIEPSRMSDDCKSCTEIRPIQTLRKAEKLVKHNSDNLENTIIDGAQVVERIKAFEAQLKAGEKNEEDYSILFRDCEQFAKWCRYGLGLKRRQMSTEDIKNIKDVRMFVQGEFSDRSNEDIQTLRMLQLWNYKAAIGKDSGHVKGSRDIAEPQALETSMLSQTATCSLDSLLQTEQRKLLRPELTEVGAGFIQSVLTIVTR